MSQPTHTVMDSPVGPLTLVAADGVLCGLYMDGQRHLPAAETFGQRDDTVLTGAVGQVEEYFAGRRTQFDVSMTFAGSAFQRSVWDALRDIPYGHTVSYGELAGRIGNPAASRAVGLANGRNPIGIIVPCHRVVGSTGRLTGYGGGLERKQFLLEFERSHRSGAAVPGPRAVARSTAAKTLASRSVALCCADRSCWSWRAEVNHVQRGEPWLEQAVSDDRSRWWRP
jgi:methylated-DNA-[protein]-cysteine S-methyltransferase